MSYKRITSQKILCRRHHLVGENPTIKTQGQEKNYWPPSFHDRFNLEFPVEESILQHQLEDLKQFTLVHSMKINSKKTKCLPFISSKTKVFVPTLFLEKGNNLEVIYKLKLVGIVVTSDLNWQSHIDYTISRVNKTIWQLVRFK